MNRFGTWALLLGLSPAHANRVDSQTHAGYELVALTESSAFAAFEHIAMAEGFIEANANETQSPNDRLCHWTPELQRTFHNERMVGAGATACVFIADQRSNGMRMAIKVAKHGGRLNAWRTACEEMQQIRLAACYRGREFLELTEQYMPTCTYVGSSEPAFYVMHAAGTTGIGQSERSGSRGLGMTMEQKKSIFSQLAASVYALHSIGFAHNDLHGNNIVLNGDELAMIDYSDASPLQTAWIGAGLKRDGNAVWRWAASLAGCHDQSLEYLRTPRSGKAEKEAVLLECVRTGFGADSEFMTAYRNVIVASREESVDQKCIELFRTNFVQQYLPSPKVIYPWEGSNGCLQWDWSTIDRSWEVRDCLDIPGGAGQCRIDIYPGACYGGSRWGCWAPGEAFSPSYCRGRGGHEGACSFAQHGHDLTDADINVCSDHCTEQCNGRGHWGACYLDDPSGVPSSRQCHCVDDAGGRPPQRFIKQACLTTSVHGMPDRAFNGLCKLPGRSLTAPPAPPPRPSHAPAHRPRIATTTRTTTTVDLSILTTPACICQDGGVVNGVQTNRAGCHAHLGSNFGNFCYISGGAECPGSRLSRRMGLYWRHCEA